LHTVQPDGGAAKISSSSAGLDGAARCLNSTRRRRTRYPGKAFAEAVDVTAICLAKLDGTSKGGMVFAISDQLGVPVRFIGTGESPEDLSPFSAEEFVEALFQ
jgi:fused signal recognition particle receptor